LDRVQLVSKEKNKSKKIRKTELVAYTIIHCIVVQSDRQLDTHLLYVETKHHKFSLGIAKWPGMGFQSISATTETYLGIGIAVIL